VGYIRSAGLFKDTPARRWDCEATNVTFNPSITAVSAVAALHFEFARTNWKTCNDPKIIKTQRNYETYAENT
jgi:hypothetical protein